MKYMIVLGTRPEIIKFSPVVRELISRDMDFEILHTNQHYSYEMDQLFFEELELPPSAINLDVGSGSHGQQTGKMLIRIEKALAEESDVCVLVEGDTNTVAAGALVGAKQHMPVGHVEAGLRSFDRSMPEEINRVIADHISDYLFAPTEVNRRHLSSEGIEEDKIFVVGNTIVDATYQNRDLAKADILDKYDLTKGGYILSTFHRQENVDDKKRLANILEALGTASESLDMPVMVPMHPRTRKRIQEFGYGDKVPKEMTIIPPVGYLHFLALEVNAALAVTDSGGVQEETCILDVPCVTIRDNTERPETVDMGKNVVAGTEPQKVTEAIRDMVGKDLPEGNPYGEGDTAGKMMDILVEKEEA